MAADILSSSLPSITLYLPSLRLHATVQAGSPVLRDAVVLLNGRSEEEMDNRQP